MALLSFSAAGDFAHGVVLSLQKAPTRTGTNLQPSTFNLQLHNQDHPLNHSPSFSYSSLLHPLPASCNMQMPSIFVPKCCARLQSVQPRAPQYLPVLKFLRTRVILCGIIILLGVLWYGVNC
jgi:hypothetical protein